MTTRFTASLLKNIINGRQLTHSDLNPTLKETGRWRAPLLSMLQQARLRRLARIFNVAIPGITDIERPPIRLAREPKGTLKERRMNSKRREVEERMQKMPQLIEKYKAERLEQRKKLKNKALF